MSRRAFVEILLNGTDITKDISEDTLSLSYTDNASGDADDLTISIQNRSKKWMKQWFPNTGDTLSAKIITKDWYGTLDCGNFVLDSVDFSGWPLTVSMKAVDMPVGTDFCEVPRNKTWEKSQLSGIAASIAENGGLTLKYEASYDPLLPFVSQTDKKDKQFLFSLCEKYGLTMKLYSNQLIIYDMAEIEQEAAIMTLTENDMTSFSARATITGSGYTGCSVSYTDKDGKVLEYTHTVNGTTPKIHKEVKSVSSLAEAERVAKAKLRELNIKETTVSCELLGNCALVAGLTVEISGFGVFDAKYLIDKAAHKVGGGYKTSLELHKVV